MDGLPQSFQKEYDRVAEEIRRLDSPSAQFSNNGPEAIDSLQVAITQLSERVRDAASDIPAHDRKIYGERLKTLQLKLKERQTAIAPKKKFAFSSKGAFSGRNKESALNVPQSRPIDSNTNGETVPKSKVENETKNIPPSGVTSFTYESHNGTRFHFDAEGGEHASGPCYLSNLISCIVDMRGVSGTTSFASLTGKDIENCIIICDHVNGPAHLTNIRNSIILVSAQQFRMHKSQSCDVYLQTPSRPIIEDCSVIRFAALPNFLRRAPDKDTGNEWTEVDDFNWHRSEPSPNWSLLKDEDLIRDERWQNILQDRNSTAQDVLKSVSLRNPASVVSESAGSSI